MLQSGKDLVGLVSWDAERRARCSQDWQRKDPSFPVAGFCEAQDRRVLGLVCVESEALDVGF